MPKHILVVDDNRYAQLAFVYALKETGYEVDTASSGKEALEKVEAKQYDLIFLDLKMPEMDGVDTLRHLQKVRPAPPVYIVTAYKDEFMQRLRAAAQDGLAFQIAAKPLDDEQIRAVIRGVLEGPEPENPGGAGGQP